MKEGSWVESYFCFVFFYLLFSCGSESSFERGKNETQGLNRSIALAYQNCVLLEEDCPMEKISFSNPLKNEKKSLGQRILIIDSEREPSYRSLFFVNRGRVISLYRKGKQSSEFLEKFEPSILAPKFLSPIFESIRSFNKKGLSINQLKINKFYLLKLHHKIKPILPKKFEVSHGEYVFDLLARHNPKSSFVLAPFPEVEKKVFCNFSYRAKEIEDYFKRASASFLRVIKEEKINFVNLSYASTYNSLSQHNKILCDGSLKKSSLLLYLKYKSDFLDSLSDGAPDTLFFQAMPNDYEDSYLKNSKSNIFSCKERRNFIKVSFWNQNINRPWKYKQEDLRKLLPSKQEKLWNFVHYYINGGFGSSRPFNRSLRRGRPTLELLYFGFYPSKSFFMSNSFATPIALSYVNYLIRKNRFSLEKKIHKKIVDPIARSELLSFAFRRGEFI